MKMMANLLFLLLIVSPAWGQIVDPICGDCDMDQRVTVADALLALQAANQSVTLSTDQQLRCDVDISMGPTTVDGLLIAQFSAGILPTLGCHGQTVFVPPARPPVPSLDPATGLGNCVQGQSIGKGWTFEILGGPTYAVPALPRSATANEIANRWVNVINTPPTNYVATLFGNCFFLQSVAGGSASVRIHEAGTTCTPDLGAACNFGAN